MSEHFTASNYLSPEQNKKGEEINAKLVFADKLNELCVVTDDTDIDLWFDHVAEVEVAYKSSREVAETLVAIEYSLLHNNNHLSEEALNETGRMAHLALVSKFPNIGDEEISAFNNLLNLKITEGQGFLDAFHSAISERKEAMESNESFDVYVDAEGVVSRNNENIQVDNPRI
jgi:hypothetical protein